jgi:molecular chaperone GrpE
MTKKTTSQKKQDKHTSSQKKDDCTSYKEQINSLEETINQLEDDLKETKDKLLRSYADYQNYQKRVEKNFEQTKAEIKQVYLSEFIDIKELLLKAIEDDNPKAGLRLILKQIEHFFDEEHVSTIDCIGKQFNHNLHHAVTTIEQDDCEENTIIEEIKKGYKIDETVLRPSHVVVAKKKSS